MYHHISFSEKWVFVLETVKVLIKNRVLWQYICVFTVLKILSLQMVKTDLGIWKLLYFFIYSYEHKRKLYWLGPL